MNGFKTTIVKIDKNNFRWESNGKENYWDLQF